MFALNVCLLVAQPVRSKATDTGKRTKYMVEIDMRVGEGCNYN